MKKNLLLLILFVFSFSAIHAEEFSWEFKDGTLIISGTNMPDYETHDAPWYKNYLDIKKVVIKDGVTNIGSHAFESCDFFTSIEIPNSVTSIGEEAFYDCSGLTSVTMGNSVTSIGKGAFFACYALASVTIPNSVTSIGNSAFHSCKSLTSIEIPNSVTSIGVGAFSFCSGLTSVTMGNSVTSIGRLAFAYCNNITSLTIGNSVKTIGEEAFYGCSSLTSITIPNSVTIIENSAFKLCSGLTSVTIPNSVTSIGNDAFLACNDLTSVTIGNSVTSIGEKAFSYCGNLTSVTIGNSVTSIGVEAFQDCNNITSVEIPNSVKNIGNRAFFNCENITSITFNGSEPPEFGKDVFYGVNKKTIPVYVPGNSKETYKNVLRGFSNIQTIKLSLNANDSYTQDSQIDNIDVSYTRDFGWTWEAIYLPFSLKYEDWKDDFKVARINAVRQYDTDDDGKIDRTEFEFVKMKEGSVIYPNTPYLILAKTPGENTIYVENTTVYKAENKSVECSTTTEQFTFIGTYKRISFFDIIWNPPYVLDGSRLKKATSSIDPYRWYMKRENRNSVYGINNNNTAKEISIRVVGEETTGIRQLQITNDELPVYDINGRRVNENNLKPGMYVKNGRKFVVK